MQEKFRQAVKDTCQKLFNTQIEPEISRPDGRFGDYATNAALHLAKQLNQSPRELAQKLAGELKNMPELAGVDVAGPGFINFKLTDGALQTAAAAAADLAKPHAGQQVVVEYSDPNPFKVLHAGHLYTSVVGDAIANLLQAAGADVHRVNFGGDVGLHVAKTMFAIIQNLGGEQPEKLGSIALDQRARWLAGRYVEGNDLYEDDPAAKAKIDELNQKIYAIQDQQDKTSPLAQIYWTTRGWSYEYFDEFYARIGTHFEKYYPESETVAPGVKAVKDNIGKVFEESEGAIVFKGEVHNLHTRVFINRQGLPTYEAKDVGLVLKKWEDYHFDKSVVITGNEIYEYMQVVLKAVDQFAPELVQKTVHITHGLVKLAGGAKMSSRLGNIIGAQDVLDAAVAANKEINGQEDFAVALGAVKYAFLKNRIGPDLIFDPKESVSLEGNSGPYLQYAFARANSILQKSTVHSPQSTAGSLEPRTYNLDPPERSLARKVSEYPEVVATATAELMPHHICTYLYELAQVFNSFYEKSRIIGDGRENLRLELVKSYSRVLKSGLNILNIEAPERM